MRGAGRKDEAVTGLQLHRDGIGSDQEGDRAGCADQQLGVLVAVNPVPVAGTVGPGVRLDAGVSQADGRAASVGRLLAVPRQVGERRREGSADGLGQRVIPAVSPAIRWAR
jgi:hypothetical protein